MTHKKEMRVWTVIGFGLMACLLYGLGAGIRGDIGILLNPLAKHSGLSYQTVSFCIAVMELVFGVSQPFFGMLAKKRSNRFVLNLGILLLLISFMGMYQARTVFTLMFALGFVFGAGAGALSFGLILSSAIHFVGEKNAMLISGMLNAAAGMISFILSPTLTMILHQSGLGMALIVLGIVSIVLVPINVIVTSRDKKAIPTEQPKKPSTHIWKEAFQHPTYRLLMAGFTTCGFHMIIIESHLYSQYLSYGLSTIKAGWAFSVYGIATIIGALLSGWLSTRIHKGHLLGFYYGFRAVWAIGYLFIMPKTFLTAVLFAIGLGLTGDATVSPTSGLVSEHFALEDVAVLVGSLFAAHQIGAFLSAWLGGIIEVATGGYTLLWIIDVILCVIASICSLRIGNEPDDSARRTKID